MIEQAENSPRRATENEIMSWLIVSKKLRSEWREFNGGLRAYKWIIEDLPDKH